MSVPSASRRELHLQIKQADELHVPGQPLEPLDIYCVASLGHQRHRTRLLEGTTAPAFNEEFVFDVAPEQTDGLVRFELFQQGMFSDTLLFYAFLPLEHTSSSSSSGSHGVEDDPALDDAAIAAAAAASRQSFAAGSAPARVPGALAARQASQAVAAKATAAVLRGGDAAAAAGVCSEVFHESLALLPAAGGSGLAPSGVAGLLGGVMGAAAGPGSLATARSLQSSKTRLRRSTRSARRACELHVAVWWVQQPALANAGTPPCVLSFVHPPSQPHSLPSALHTDDASLWEEPCCAFLRLCVARVHLGPAAASTAGGGRGSKALLRRLTGLLKGDAAAAEEVQVGLAEAHALEPQDRRPRPTLQAIKGGGALGTSFRADGLGTALAQWDFQTSGLDALPEEDEDDDDQDSADDDGSVAASRRSSSTSGGGGWRQRHSQQQQQQQAQQGRASPSPSAGGATASGRDKQLHLTVKVRLGDAVRTLRPVPVSSDGLACVQQAAVFVVTRPLEEAIISYELGLGRGPHGPPLLVLVFSYSLLHLLRRSPPHPVAFEEYRAVARATVAGLQVPLPVLPAAFLDLSAFLADADCRAGMYSVPPVSAAALAAAADDDAKAAAAAAAEVEAAAAAAARAKAADALTDSDDDDDDAGGARRDDVSGSYDFVAALDQSHLGTASSLASSGGSGGLRGVLRRRAAPGTPGAAAAAAAAAEQQRRVQAAAGAQQHPHLDKFKESMMGRVEAGLTQAMAKLPDNVAQHVRKGLFDRLFPRSRRSEVFAIGQLRVPTVRPARASDGTQPSTAGSGGGFGSGSGGGGARMASSAGAAASACSSSGGSALGAGSEGGHAAAVAAAAAAAGVAPLAAHPNLAVSGAPGMGPLGVLQLTLQAVNLRRGRMSAGYSLLLKSGVHWLELSPGALPLTITSSTEPDDGRSTCHTPPVQVLLPIYGTSSLVALVLHRRATVVGRAVFRLHGLLPLLLRDHTKLLTLYSDKRGAGGGRIIAGSVLLRLAAGPPLGCSWPAAVARLALTYFVTPHTLAMHSSGVLASMGRDERTAATGEVVLEWLDGQGQAAIPDALARQMVSTGRSALSTARMRGHVRRIKAVLLDWLPRRLDPLAFYYWRRPLHNVLFLWVASHVLLYPGHWVFAVALLISATLLRRIAIQLRAGVLGFELGLEQLTPPELGVQHSAAGAGDTSDDEQLGSDPSELRSSGGGQLGERQRYREAADKLRNRLAGSKHKARHVLGASSDATALPDASMQRPQRPTAAAPLPRSLEELREQLEAGTLSLDALDIEAAVQQLLSVGGLLRLARQHTPSLLAYGLVAQNMLDDAAGFAEGLYAALTGQDPLAGLLFCAITVTAAAFCRVAGLGAGLFVLLAVLLRPPLLRGVPGVVGWKSFLRHLRGHGRSLEELAW